MRTLFGILTLVACMAYSQTPQQPFAITISADKTEIEQGDPVDLRIVITNTSNQEVDCTGAPSNGLDRNFLYYVTFEDGKSAPLVVRRHPEIGETGNIWPCTIKPTETAEAAGGRISVLYDFNQPGKYKIQVARHSSFDAESPLIKSNVVNVTVLPANQTPTGKK